MASNLTADCASSPRPKSATTFEIRSTVGKFPRSATKQEAVPNKKSPTSVAARSPCSICVVSSPRRLSAPSKMSSCTSEAEWRTSMLAANPVTRSKLASGAPNARAISSTSAGLSRLPPLPKSLPIAFRTSSLSAFSANGVLFKILFTFISSLPMQTNEPSRAAFGPSSGHFGAGTALAPGTGPLPRPVAINLSNSPSASTFREKPRPLTGGASPSSPSGYTYCSSRLRRNSSNSPKLRPL
mmetsp:Transcript_83920/g.166568  ORF Transcript_83920/g.166568 Transcript_83920/m.166568 type:complete len:241 (+) Transcript_83920:577-1299(+)